MAETPGPEMSSQLIAERLIGATGDDEQVTGAARACAQRALPPVTDGLKGKLSFPLAIEIQAVDVVRIADSVPDEDSRVAMTILPSNISRDALTMQLDPDALSILVGALFGSEPTLPPAPIERELSEIELDIAAVVFNVFAESINGKGARSLGIRFPLAPPVAGDDLKRLVVRDGPGVRITFSIATEVASGTLKAWMPQRVILEKRGDHAGDEAANAKWRSRFNEEVMRSTVEASATVPLARMTLGEIAGLAEGQVLELPEGAQTGARLSVRGSPVFVCEFGRLGNHYTVRVRNAFDVRQDLIEGLLAG